MSVRWLLDFQSQGRLKPAFLPEDLRHRDMKSYSNCFYGTHGCCDCCANLSHQHYVMTKAQDPYTNPTPERIFRSALSPFLRPFFA